MFRRSSRFFHFNGTAYGATSGNALGYTGALGGFYGNLYQGRVSSEDYAPKGGPLEKQNTHLYIERPTYADDDPQIRPKLDKCPYFALCDMVVWHGMAPTYLDPGLLTREEHHLLLLFSRAYYEKWREIHSHPREFASKARVKLGRFSKCIQIFEHLNIPYEKIKKAQQLYFDDSSLIAMHPNLWVSAHMDDILRDQLTGRVLRKAGFADDEVDRVVRILESMRTLLVRRSDLPGDDKKETIVPFREAPTLYDLYRHLELRGDQHVVKCHNYIVEGMPKRTITLGGEDQYFDFCVDTFFEANPAIAETNSAARFVLSIDPMTRLEAGFGNGVAV